MTFKSEGNRFLWDIICAMPTFFFFFSRKITVLCDHIHLFPTFTVSFLGAGSYARNLNLQSPASCLTKEVLHCTPMGKNLPITYLSDRHPLNSSLKFLSSTKISLVISSAMISTCFQYIPLIQHLTHTHNYGYHSFLFCISYYPIKTLRSCLFLYISYFLVE